MTIPTKPSKPSLPLAFGVRVSLGGFKERSQGTSGVKPWVVRSSAEYLRIAHGRSLLEREEVLQHCTGPKLGFLKTSVVEFLVSTRP